jgi:DNA-binding CsgD family transcriptional regulator
MLNGNRNMTSQAKVDSATSREIPPTWSKSNLVDMETPLGLPLAPGKSEIVDWQGLVATSVSQPISVTVDLGEPFTLDEIRLLPAWRRSLAWDTYYGFPGQFRIEGSEDDKFARPVLIHEQGSPGLKSPGQNILNYPCPDRPLRFIRMTATRLRNRTGDFTLLTTPVSLSPRQREMLALIVEGLTVKEMADRLDVSIHTIDTHTRHLFKKLDVRSRAAAVARAMRERMV